MWDFALNAEEAFCVKATASAAHKEPSCITALWLKHFSLKYPKLKRKCAFNSAVCVNPVSLGI